MERIIITTNSLVKIKIALWNRLSLHDKIRWFFGVTVRIRGAQTTYVSFY